MKTPYVISELKDGRYAVHNTHPGAMEWYCVDTMKEAQEKLSEKNKEYLDFIDRMKSKKIMKTTTPECTCANPLIKGKWPELYCGNCKKTLMYDIRPAPQ